MFRPAQVRRPSSVLAVSPLLCDPVWSPGININRPQMIPSLPSRTPGSDDVPIAAELYSGTFIIYSTKECVLPMAVLKLAPRLSCSVFTRMRGVTAPESYSLS